MLRQTVAKAKQAADRRCKLAQAAPADRALARRQRALTSPRDAPPEE